LNDFLHVVDLGVDGMAAIDWDALAKLTDKKEKGDENRQHKFKDFGTTAGQCTTHVGSLVGVAKPSYILEQRIRQRNVGALLIHQKRKVSVDTKGNAAVQL
jgi:hypothetical protein